MNKWKYNVLASARLVTNVTTDSMIACGASEQRRTREHREGGVEKRGRRGEGCEEERGE